MKKKRTFQAMALSACCAGRELGGGGQSDVHVEWMQRHPDQRHRVGRLVDDAAKLGDL